MRRSKNWKLLRAAFAISLAIHFSAASLVRVNAVQPEPPPKIRTIQWLHIRPPKPTPPPRVHRHVAFHPQPIAPSHPQPPSLPRTNDRKGPPVSPPIGPPGNPQPPGGNGTNGPGQPTGPAETSGPACDTPDISAKAVDPITPDFPEDLKAAGFHGTAEIRVDLDSSGRVTGVSVYQSSGSMQLDRLALEAAKASRYSPERRNCSDVAGSYLFKVDFDSL